MRESLRKPVNRKIRLSFLSRQGLPYPTRQPEISSGRIVTAGKACQFRLAKLPHSRDGHLVEKVTNRQRGLINAPH
jgi:hypothetical protein